MPGTEELVATYAEKLGCNLFSLFNYLPSCNVKMGCGAEWLEDREKLGNSCQARDDEHSEYKIDRVEIQAISLR
jgi:hypothetical protein